MLDFLEPVADSSDQQVTTNYLVAQSDKTVAIRSEAHRGWRRPGREMTTATGNSHRR